MWTVFKYLLIGLAGLLLFSLPLFFLTNWLLGKDFPNLGRLFSFLFGHWGGLAVGIVVAAALALYAHQRDRLKTLQNRAFIYKRARALRPFDMVPAKAWYHDYFLQRTAVDRAVGLLASNKGVLLLGVPLIGKTRCAYEALKKLKGHYVLGLAPDNKTDDIKLPRSWVFRKPRLILLLDDIDSFLGRLRPDSFYKQLERQVKSIAVLATCRSGQEHKLIAKDQVFGSFVSLNLTEVRVQQLTKSEEKILATRFGREWYSDKYNGTPGAIVLGIDRMRARLDCASQDVKTLMRSLCLMRKAGIRTYRLALAEAVASTILGSKATRVELDSAWLWLKDEAFLDIDVTRGVVSLSHAVYLGEEFYPEFGVRDPGCDVFALWTVVSEAGNLDDMFSIALRWAEQKDYARAEAAYRKCLDIEPNEPNARSNLGSLLSDIGRNQEAESEFREAIRIHPNLTGAHSNLGNLLKKLGRHYEAEEAYNEAIRIDPDFSSAHYNLGNLLSDTGRNEEAEKKYREAIRIDSNSAAPHYNLGSLLFELGRNEEAEKEFRRAIEISPRDAGAYSNLGMVLKNLSQIIEAEQQYREAIRIDPDMVIAHCNLAALLSDLGRNEEAEAEYEQSIRINPDIGATYYNLAVLLTKLGRNEEAEQRYRKAILIDPDLAAAHSNLGLLLKRLGRIDEAEKEFRETIRIDPNLAAARVNLASLLTRLGRNQEAEQEQRESIRINPDLAESHYNLGVLLVNRGQHREAESEYREAIRINPDFGAAHYNLGNLLLELERIEEAEKQYRETVRIRPDDLDAHYNLGSLLEGLGRDEEAEKQFRNVISISPGDAGAHYNLGYLLTKLGRKEEAVREFREAIRLNPELTDIQPDTEEPVERPRPSRAG